MEKESQIESLLESGKYVKEKKKRRKKSAR